MFKFNPFSRDRSGRLISRDADLRNLKGKDFDKLARKIEETIDKLFPGEIREIKVTELPRVDVIEVKREKSKKVGIPKDKAKQEISFVEKRSEEKEHARIKKDDVEIIQKKKIEKEADRINQMSNRSSLETPSSLGRSGRADIGSISPHLKKESIEIPKKVDFFNLGVDRKKREVKIISPEPDKRKHVIEEREPEIKSEKKIQKNQFIEKENAEKIKPLVDLSMRSFLDKILISEENESKKKEDIDMDVKSEDVEIEKLDDTEDFLDYTFFDETESLKSDAFQNIRIDKMDYGDVELPRESLRFEPMVEFKPKYEEEEINIPIVTDRFEEVDFYSVNRPYAYIKVLKDKKSIEKIYAVLEPELSESEREYLDFIKETLDSIPDIDFTRLYEKGEVAYLENLIDQIFSDYSINLSEDSKKKLMYILKRDMIGYGKIDAMMKDPYIEDISCDGSKIPVFVYHRNHGSMRTNISFENEEEISSFVIKLAQKCGKHISIAEPMLDATLPDGSRIQATLGTEITTRGSTFTIRKFRAIPFSPLELVKMNTLSPEMLVYLWLAVENGASGLFAGGTASGKTTTLNAVSLFIPREAKIVSIEETREINLPHPNWIPGVTRSGFGEVVADKVVGEIDMYDLLKAALRQRPEYIIVGEIRGREAYVLFQAMATGHTTYSTMHADSPQSLIHRLEGKPMNVPRVMMQSLDFICFHSTTRIKDKRERRITQIMEIVDIDPVTKEIITNEVFSWDSITDTFRYSGRSYLLEKIRARTDISKEEMLEEINNRIKIIKWMIKSDIVSFRDAVQIINEYADNPSEVLKKVEEDGRKEN